MLGRLFEGLDELCIEMGIAKLEVREASHAGTICHGGLHDLRPSRPVRDQSTNSVTVSPSRCSLCCHDREAVLSSLILSAL